MEEIVNKCVLVHSCRIAPNGRPRDLLLPEERYVGDLGKTLEEQMWYYALPAHCRCKRYITSVEATDFVSSGWAVWVLMKNEESAVPDETKIWMPLVRERVPRVDLVSRADIERAYIGSERKSLHYTYNRMTKKYVKVRTIPEGKTLKEWMDEDKKETKFEQRIREQFKNYIEECHNVTMEARAKLMVPFSPDPFEGRTLFSFSPDMRTVGGYRERE